MNETAPSVSGTASVNLGSQIRRKSPAVAVDSHFRVALVAMPFAATQAPSIQLGLLSAIARGRGYHVDTFHLNLDFAKLIGVPVYDVLSSRGLLGEWMFSPSAFGEATPDPDATYLELLPADFVGQLSDQLGENWRESLVHMRHLASEYIDRLVTSAPWDEYSVIGFTSTFQQQVPSLALAERLRQRSKASIVFGGANMEGEMGEEYVRAFPSITYAINGEADEAFPALLDALAHGTAPEAVPGVISSLKPSDFRQTFERVDELPFPAYDEFYERARAVGVDGLPDFRTLPIETARGCWW